MTGFHPLFLAGSSAAFVLIAPAVQAETRIGAFTNHADVGSVGFPGVAKFDDKTGAYTITASGTNMWGKVDAFHFVSREASGDLRIAADIAFLGQGKDPHRKAGVMIRQSLAPDDIYADVVVHGDGLVSLQYRATPGGETHQIEANVRNAKRVQLEREGDYVYMALAGEDGVLHPVGGGFRLKMDGPYLAGLAVCSHDNSVTETAVLSNVEIAPLPAPPPAKGYGDKYVSALETIDIASGNRKVVYTLKGHIEAPNWTPDGKAFIYNSGGLLYRLPVTGGAPVKIDSGALIKMNNDHGISPDGTQLVVSDQTEADNQSRIHILPIGGGQPRKVTEKGPSYWHGWSPDGKTLAFIANRDGDYEVWSIPAAGGAETRLTNSKGLDDGAEYTPDGKWIWFNSVRSGNMKLWRMKPDGTAPQQMTANADSRDWFPHPSPDGKWIAFVAFGTDIDVGDHPPSRNVVLKVMPAEGGEARIITSLFGGQGTMNVPSWSPDSKSVAFVSYRVVP